MNGLADLFMCTGDGDPRHGGAVPCEWDEDEILRQPGGQRASTAIVVRCPACGRRERIGARRGNQYIRDLAEGRITEHVDISALHR